MSSEIIQQFRVLQVSNISPSATKDQVHSLFTYIGRIDDLKVLNIKDLSNPIFIYYRFILLKTPKLNQSLLMLNLKKRSRLKLLNI